MTELTYTDITYEVSGSATIITLNRPEQLNAITSNMGIELRHALATAEDDKNIAGIVITGAGKAFCSGVDMQDLQQAGQTGGAAKRSESIQKRKDELRASPGYLDVPEGFRKGGYAYFASISKPIIAAVNGAVAGAALSIILSSDMRFFGESGFVSSSFAKRGLIAELGTAWILPRLVGPDTALDILWSGRKISAKEAREMKLATRVYPDDALIGECIAYINELAENCALVSIAGMKGQVYRDLFRDPTESFKEAHQLMLASLKQPDFVEGVKSFLEKRRPNFKKMGKD